jgi:hypothetical protein
VGFFVRMQSFSTSFFTVVVANRKRYFKNSKIVLVYSTINIMCVVKCY